ncbi:MAG: hypothetical protein VW230_03620 [Candidatus Poseidoniales archaeon]
MTPFLQGKNGLIIGIALLVVNMAVLAPMSTGAVEDAVQENVATKPLDDACTDGNCDNVEEDWASSTESRDFYAYSITNLAAMMSDDVAPTYEMLGPFTYDVTSTKTVVEHNSTAGTLTYNEVISYECAADSANDCTTPITNLNIAFMPQVIGATGTAVAGIMDLTKVGFSAQAMANDLENMQAGKAVAASIGSEMAASDGSEAMDAAYSAGWGNGAYQQFDAYFAAMNGSGFNNETVAYSYTDFITMQIQARTSDNTSVFGGAAFEDLSYALNSAMMPTGDSVNLLSTQGPLAFAGHCEAYPTATYDEVMADAANGFANVGSMQRATVWGFMAMANETMPDIETTLARDAALCFAVGGGALMAGAGDETWMMDTTGMSVNASARLYNMLGVTIDNMIAMNLLFNGTGTDMPLGLFATNEDGDDFGLAAFMGITPADAMATYMLDEAQYGAVMMWAGGWLTDASSIPLVLLGGTGTMTASQFVNTSFGNVNPIDGTYLEYSLNLGGLWMMLGNAPVELTPEQSGNLLYGPLGLTTQAGATLFIYGEMAGQTPPINFLTMQPDTPMPWADETVAALYQIDVNAARAVRLILMDAIMADFVPGFLMDNFGTTPYITMEMNQWLLGWHDPVNAYLETGNPMDMSAGWMSLETNATYYGSGGIANGDGTQYTICTGENADCDKGEMLLQDGSPYVSWRDMEKAAGTLGILTPESLEGATGGFITGDGDKVDLSGYGVVDLVCTDGSETVKDIPVTTCTASMDPTTRSVQAKLLGTDTLLDALPGALPVYFGSDVNVKAEDMSGAIISGTSKSTFYLDTREMGNQATAPTMDDLQPVFIIETSGELSDSDADSLQSAIYTNQEFFGYWTNFDHPIDFVTLLFYIAGVALLVLGLYGMAGSSEDEEMKIYSSSEESAAEEADDATEESSEEDTE